MDEEGDVWVGEKVEGFARGGIRCHDDDRSMWEVGGGVVEGVRGEVGVVHERHMRFEVYAGCKMELG